MSKDQKVCQSCFKRPAKFVLRGRDGNLRWAFRKDHDLCRQCFESLRDKRQAMLFVVVLLEPEFAPPVSVPGSGRRLGHVCRIL
jgi:hypothetical protein